MKSFLKLSAWTLFAMLLACLVGAGLVMGFAQEGLAQSGNWQVVVDGDTVANAQMLREHWQHEEWNGVEAFFGIAITFFVLLLMVPLLLLGVGLPLLVVLLAFGAVAASLLGVAALLSAPLLLPILLIVWIARRRPKVAA